MAKGRITLEVDANGAITNLTKFQKQLDGTNRSAKQMQKSLQANNTQGNTTLANADFKDFMDQLRRQADAYKIVDESGNSYIRTVKLYEKAMLDASKQNQYNIEQLSELQGEYEGARKKLNLHNKEIGKSLSAFDSFKKKMFEVGKNILIFQTAIAVFRKTITFIGNTIKESMQSAASAEQVFNKLSTVYDGYSQTAERAAKNLATTLGVANSTAASSLSTIGDLLQAQGMSVSQSLETATDWAKKLQDIIAFKDLNTTLEEFAQNFMSGAAGNLRNFRTFGSIVKESSVEAELASKNLDKLTGSELELAKMTIRAEMALAQQANAIGATEREWDTVLSINRRLEEASKQWKENLGDTLNNAIKPIKKWWVEILETINEVNKQQKEYNEAQKNGEYYYNTSGKNPTNDAQSRAQMISGVQSILFSLQTDFDNSSTWVKDFKEVAKTTGEFDSVVNNLKEIMSKTNATVEDINSRWALSSDLLSELASFEKKRNEELAKQVKLEEKLSSMQASFDLYDTLSESLNAIAGVNIAQSPLQLGNNSNIEALVREQSLQESKEAAKQIMKATAETMGKSFEEAVNEFDSSELLEMQIESMRTLLEMSWNSLISGGLSVEEINSELKGVINDFAKLKKDLETLKLKETIEQSLTEMFTNIDEDNLFNIDKKYAKETLKYTDQQAESYAELQKELRNVRAQFDQLGTSTLMVGNEMRTLAEAEEYLKTKYEEELSKGSKDGDLNSMWSVLQDISGALSGVVENLINQMNGETITQGDWVMAIIQIAKSMETFEHLFASADRSISIIDAFLRPLSPALKVLTEAIENIIVPILQLLFPIIKIIASAVTVIAAVIDVIRITIKNIVVLCHNILEWIAHPAKKSKRDIWSFESYSDAFDKMNETLKEIWSTTFEIKENTEDVNTSAYDEMYRQGLITLSEYNALLSSAYNRDWDLTKTFAGGSYANGSGGTSQVYVNGGIQITIDGTNLNAEEIAHKVKQVFTSWEIAGNATYA